MSKFEMSRRGDRVMRQITINKKMDTSRPLSARCG